MTNLWWRQFLAYFHLPDLPEFLRVCNTEIPIRFQLALTFPLWNNRSEAETFFDFRCGESKPILSSSTFSEGNISYDTLLIFGHVTAGGYVTEQLKFLSRHHTSRAYTSSCTLGAASYRVLAHFWSAFFYPSLISRVTFYKNLAVFSYFLTENTSCLSLLLEKRERKRCELL